MEIIEFINNGKELTSEPILTEFVNSYPMQNDGILGKDAIEFARLFNPDVSLVEDNNYRIRTQGVLMYVLCGSHMFYMYNNEDEHVIEKWDPATWQKSTNNCTLYAAILAAVRPLLSFEDTAKLIGRILDTPNTESAKRLAEISNHFFARDITHFKYSINLRDYVSPSVVKKIEKDQIGQCLIMIKEMTQEEIEFLALDFKNKKRDLIDAITSRDGSIYTVSNDKTVFGFMNMFKKENYNYIDILYVASKFRGNGYATKLIKFVIEKGINVRLRVKPNNRTMISLVEKLGFTDITSSDDSVPLLYEYKA